ncbi:MAG: O-antigen polymerase [Planctomycetota bacterium]
MTTGYVTSVAAGHPAADAGRAVRSDRSPVVAVLLLLPVLIALASWLGGGTAFLTDAAMTVATTLCVLGIILELRSFNTRIGVGALTLYGGFLIWIAHDYFTYWGFRDLIDASSTRIASGNAGLSVLAEAAFANTLLLACAAFGLLLPWPAKLLKPFTVVPEPNSPSAYVWIPTVLCVIGLVPFFLFTNEPFYTAILNEILGGYGGSAAWTVGRTGNTNYSWGGYVAHFITLGVAGGVLAGCLATYLPRLGTARRTYLYAIWVFWTLLQFGTGARGKLVAIVMPVVVIAFLRMSVEVAQRARRVSLKAYAASFVLVGLLYVAVQAMNVRNLGFTEVDVVAQATSKVEGNEMFTAGLTAFSLVPEKVSPFYATFPGAALIRPLPDTAIRFALHPIPRALWPGKPIDPVWLWYNEMVTGKSAEEKGTTVSTSLAAEWYVRYGIVGVVQGGLLFGFLLVGVELVIRRDPSRAMTVFIALGVLAYLFRAFRNFNPANLVPVFLAAIFLAVLIRTLNLVMPAKSN